MRRAPIVVAATGAGLAALLSFHTTSLSGPTGPLVSATGPGTTGSGTAGPPNTAPTTAPTTASTTAPTTAPTTTTQATRRANGDDVEYRYGQLELQVTVKAGRISDIEPAVDEATDPRSAQINDQAIPYLRDQALQAQSAHIDGVSGATYTSDAYVQSLQAALDKLGWNK
jgi:uncharacterized protein with FMN-binding domain